MADNYPHIMALYNIGKNASPWPMDQSSPQLGGNWGQGVMNPMYRSSWEGDMRRKANTEALKMRSVGGPTYVGFSGPAAVDYTGRVRSGGGPGTKMVTPIPWRSYSGMNTGGSEARIGNEGGAMAPPSPNALEANGRPGMGSLDDFYLARSEDPITGGSARPSDWQKLQERKRLQDAGDQEGLAAMDVYRRGQSTRNPYLQGVGADMIEAIKWQREYDRKRKRAEAEQAASGGALSSSIPFSTRAVGGTFSKSSEKILLPGEVAMGDWPETFQKVSTSVPSPMAHGGKHGTLNPYLVGEEGPEIAQYKDGTAEIIGANGPEIRTFDKSGKVIPNHKIRGLADGAEFRIGDFNPIGLPIRWLRRYLPAGAPLARMIDAADRKRAELTRSAARLAAWPFVAPPPSDTTSSQMRGPIGPPGWNLDPTMEQPRVVLPGGRREAISDASGIRHDPEAEAARRDALSRHANDVFYNPPPNPYNDLPVDQQMMMAIMDRKQGITSRGQAGDVTFDNGGGIAIGPGGQKVAYGPHVVSRQAPVKFTKGHVQG